MPKRNSLCMKTCRVLLCFTILSLILSGTIYAETSDAEKLNAAVLDFTYKNVSKEDAAIISDFFRSELIKTNKFNVLDRSNIEKILKEYKLQNTGLTDTANSVEIGKLLNVQYIFVGTYSMLDASFMLTVNMVNIKTGKIEKTESRTTDINKAKNKLDMTTYIAYSFIGFGVGYELFWNGKRVGFEPEWSIEEAIKNLEWNRKTNTQYMVEGYYNGKKMP
jgi:TolB-like protein